MKNIKLITASIAFALVIQACEKSEFSTPEGFEIHPDFNLTLIASEPIVIDPIEMQFDEHGEAFVLEMPGYPLNDADSRLIKLKDEDGDGIYDTRIVFAENLGVANSFMPYKEGFLVASPPHLVWLKDTNGDDKADVHDNLMNGFGNGNLQHNYNGLTYGLDNWIYVANGGNDSNPYFEGLPEEKISIREGDLRVDIDNKEMVRIGQSSGGFKITFDEWGHMFETHNMEHTSHLVFEDRYTENLPGSPSHSLENISDHEENGTSRIYPIGEQETRVNHPEQSGYFSGACGITFYGGESFPKELNSSILVADCVLNLVHLDLLSKNGASFKTSRNREKVDFLASKDRSFRPVNMVNGPDGAMYVMDFHREVIEHPEWIPDEMEVNMDLNAGKQKGRIYRITPKEGWKSNKIQLSVNTPKLLVASLGAKTQWERNTAQRLIVSNNLKGLIPDLANQYEKSENPLARLHSMWSLEGLGGLSIAQLKKALHDPAEYIRENAIKIAEKRVNKEKTLQGELLALMADNDSRVRMQATLTLSTLSNADFDTHKQELLEGLVKQLNNFDNDQWSMRAIASVAQRNPLEFVTLEISNSKALESNSIQVVNVLSELIGDRKDQEGTVQLINEIGKNNVSDVTAFEVISGLSDGWSKSSSIKLSSKNKRAIQQALKPFEKIEDITLVRASGKLRQVLNLPTSSSIKSLLKKASASILSDDVALEKRLEYLQLIALDKFDNREQLLYKLLNSKMPLVLQKEALVQLKNSNKSTIAPKLLSLWTILGPDARKEATNILLYKSQNHDLLLTAMENNEVNLGEFNLDLERRRVLLFSKNEKIKKRAEALFSDAGVVKRKDAIDGMRPALSLQGTAAKGKEVFTNVCGSCHMFGTIGIEVGPSLTEISRKSKEQLLHDILDPNAGVDTKYLNHKLIANDGSIYLGLVYKETDKEIVLKMMGGETKTINKADVESLTSTGSSLMFEGLEGSMSHQDMADLLTFLQTSL